MFAARNTSLFTVLILVSTASATREVYDEFISIKPKVVQEMWVKWRGEFDVYFLLIRKTPLAYRSDYDFFRTWYKLPYNCILQLPSDGGVHRGLHSLCHLG